MGCAAQAAPTSLSRVLADVDFDLGPSSNPQQPSEFKLFGDVDLDQSAAPPPPQGVCRRHRCTAWAPLRARGTRAPALHRAQEFKLFGDVDLPARASEDVHAAAADASEGVELQPTTSFTLFPISPETLNLEDRSSAWRLLACTAPCCVGRASPW